MLRWRTAAMIVKDHSVLAPGVVRRVALACCDTCGDLVGASQPKGDYMGRLNR
jgi:hypothetical protein